MKLFIKLSILLIIGLFSLSFDVLATPAENFLFLLNADISKVENLVKRPDISGVQKVYTWKELEIEQDLYDFSKIESDLQYLRSLNKKLFIQIQDRFFRPEDRDVPAYLMKDPIYRGGIVAQYDNPGENQTQGSGWVAQQWNPHVRKRYQKLLSSLAEKFDGKIFGINLPETSIDLKTQDDKLGFSCNKYFNAEMGNIHFARKIFKKSYVVQYINFWPCEWNNDHRYMSRFFDFAAKHNIGLGGPDIVPNKKAQMKNAYPFFHQYKGKLNLVAMAVQKPTLTYTNTKTNKPFTREEFTEFAENYLGVNIIFWSIYAPWLTQD